MNALSEISNTKRMFTLLALYVGVIGSTLVSGSLSLMLPAAALEIGGADYYSLVTTLSGTLGVVAMPLYGYVAAKNPAIKTRLFAASMLVGAVVMFARAFANSMWMIIIPGALWGVVSAAIYVLGYSIVREYYDVEKAGVYLGLVTTFQSIACLVGPVICGFLIDNVSWRIMPHCIWPFLILAAIFSTLGINLKKSDYPQNESNASFDYTGAISLAVCMACFILALSMGSSFAPFGSMFSNVLLLLAVIGLIVLIFAIRKKGQDAFLPIGVLKDKNTRCLACACMFTNWSNMAAFFFIPMFALYVIQASGTQASLTTTLMNVAGLFMGPIFGRWIGKDQSVKKVFLSTTALRIVITVAFILLLTENTSIFLLYVLMFIAGFYSSSAGTVFSLGPQLQVEASIRVQSNSVVQVCQNLGGSIGTAVYTLVIGALGVQLGMRVAFIIALITAILAFLCVVPLKKLEAGEETA